MRPTSWPSLRPLSSAARAAWDRGLAGPRCRTRATNALWLTADSTGRQGKIGRMSRTSKLDTDPYRLLGVRPGASAEEVRRGFCRQAMLHHPDRNPGDAAAEEHFREILNAYEMVRCVVEQSAGQSSPWVDPFKARRTRPHHISAQRYARRSRNSGATFLKFGLLLVAFSIIGITPLLAYIWFTTKTDWLPGCC